MGGKRLRGNEKQKAWRRFLRYVPTAEIADELGRDHATIERIAKEEGWHDKRDEVREKTLEKSGETEAAKIAEEIDLICDMEGKIRAALDAKDIGESKADKLLKELREWIKLRHQLMGIGEKPAQTNILIQNNMQGLTEVELRALIVEEKDDTGTTESD